MLEVKAVLLPSSASASCPHPDWVERIDKNSGKPYYVNHTTKETSWTRPAHPTAGITSSASTSVHSDWVERIDKKSGKPYYVNHTTKETSWTKPVQLGMYVLV
jgi:hypothetical protein